MLECLVAILQGTTLAAGCSIGISGGRPKGTTLTTGFDVGILSGPPQGTTLKRGDAVGRTNDSVVDFNGCDQPSTGMYHQTQKMLVMTYVANSGSVYLPVHLTNKLLQREFVSNMTMWHSGVMVLVKVHT